MHSPHNADGERDAVKKLINHDELMLPLRASGSPDGPLPSAARTGGFQKRLCRAPNSLPLIRGPGRFNAAGTAPWRNCLDGRKR